MDGEDLTSNMASKVTNGLTFACLPGTVRFQFHTVLKKLALCIALNTFEPTLLGQTRRVLEKQSSSWLPTNRVRLLEHITSFPLRLLQPIPPPQPSLPPQPLLPAFHPPPARALSLTRQQASFLAAKVRFLAASPPNVCSNLWKLSCVGSKVLLPCAQG